MVENKHGGIELLRLLAMMMVVTLHVLGAGGILYNVEELSFDYGMVWLWETSCYGAVNCFALISGYVGWNKNFKYRKLIKFWLENVILVYMLCIITYVIGWNQQSLLVQMRDSVVFLHYWYIRSYLGLMIIIPVLNAFIQSTSDSVLRNFTVVSFLFFTGYTLLARNTFEFDLNKGYSILWLALCYVWGGVIAKLKWNTRLKTCTWIFVFWGGTIGAWLSKIVSEYFVYKITGQYVENTFWVTYTSPFIVCASIGLFCFFSTQYYTLPKNIYVLSKSILGVYVVHYHLGVRGRIISEKWMYLISEPRVIMYLKLVGGILTIFIVSLCISVIYAKGLGFIKHVLKIQTMKN